MQDFQHLPDLICSDLSRSCIIPSSGGLVSQSLAKFQELCKIYVVKACGNYVLF